MRCALPIRRLCSVIFPTLPSDHTIWVKGSRGAGLEHTVAWLLTSGGCSMLMW